MVFVTKSHKRSLVLLYLIASFAFLPVASTAHVWDGHIAYASTPKFISASSSEAWVNITITPSRVSGNPNDTFTIDISVVNVTDLWSLDMKLKWKLGDLLECVEVQQGPFLKDGDTTMFTKNIDNDDDELATGALLLSGTPKSGSGILANATFKVLDAGNCTLHLFDTTLANQAMGEIDHTTVDGYFYTTYPKAEPIYDTPSGPYFGHFCTPNPSHAGHPITGETLTFNGSGCYDPDDPFEDTPGGIISYRWDFGDTNINITSSPVITHVYPSPGVYTINLTVTDDEGETDWETEDITVYIHDIAITHFTVNSTAVLQGDAISINVTVLNEGIRAEDSFNVTLRYIGVEAGTIETITEKSLTTGNNATVTFEWNTTDVALGTYTLFVNAFLIDGNYVNVSLSHLEKDMADNMMCGETITVTGAVEHDIAITEVFVDPTNVRLGSCSNITVTVKNEGNIAEMNVAVNVSASDTTGVVYQAQDKLNLTAGTTKTLIFSWFNGTNTAQEGDYNITAGVPPIGEETDTADNTYPAATVTMRLFPIANFTYSPSEPSLGETVVFNASASYAPGTPAPGEPAGTLISYAWNFGDGNITTVSNPLITHIYMTAGEYSARLTVTDNDNLTWSYVEELTFAAIARGHDIAIPNVQFSPDSVIAGEPVLINATVENVGIFAESLIPVKAYYSTIIIDAQTIPDLQPGAKATLQFSWNTTDVRDGNYFLMVWADQVEGETETANNKGIGGVITIEKVTIGASAQPKTISVGETTVVDGSIETAAGPIAAAEVTLWYMPSGGRWNFLATVLTYPDGTFSYEWRPGASGAYAVKATWPSDISLVESAVQVVTVLEIPALNIFFYTTVALGATMIVLQAVTVYVLWLRKAK